MVHHVRRRHALIALVAFVCAAFGASAAPAEAGKLRFDKAAFQQCSSWNVEGASTFGALARLAPSATTARAGKTIQRDRPSRGIATDTEISGAQPQPSASFTATVPVYFHVITDGRTGNLSKATVREQINVLNLGFAGFYGGDDTGFRFVLKGLDYTNNAAWFAQETFADEVAMKSALQQGDATALNVYSTSGGGFLGWAYYPSIVVYQQYQVLDGVVINYGSVPGGHIANFNLGYTLVHEAGHWLGLAHTFEQGCQGHGDYVADTPAMSVPTSGCPVGKDTCPEAGLDPIHNFMDYSDDPCYTEFTAGQSDRAQKQWLHWRVQHGY